VCFGGCLIGVVYGVLCVLVCVGVLGVVGGGYVEVFVGVGVLWLCMLLLCLVLGVE